MPDLTIKPNAGSGNKVIIQDQAGNPVLSTADAGISSLVIKSSSAPGSPAEGEMYYNSSTKRTYIYNGSQWQGMHDLSKATGGTISNYVDGGTTYVVHIFRSSGVFTPLSPFSIDYAIVAGGGGGGQNYAGGGGAGGLLTAASYAVTAQAYTITVGAGGGSTTNGANSIIDPASGSALTAIGGGKGGKYLSSGSTQAPGVGGSGGGGASASGTHNGAAGTAGQGNAGGNYTGGNDGYQAAGGGGAGATGDSETSAGGNGGNGGIGKNEIMGLNAAQTYTLLSSINVGESNQSARYLAGGGGGSGYQGQSQAGRGGDGGLGGGGNGAGYYVDGDDSVYRYGAPGQPNTGGGGGGSGAATALNYAAGDGALDQRGGPGYAGGSGVVIIRYTL